MSGHLKRRIYRRQNKGGEEIIAWLDHFLCNRAGSFHRQCYLPVHSFVGHGTVGVVEKGSGQCFRAALVTSLATAEAMEEKGARSIPVPSSGKGEGSSCSKVPTKWTKVG